MRRSFTTITPQWLYWFAWFRIAFTCSCTWRTIRLTEIHCTKSLSLSPDITTEIKIFKLTYLCLMCLMFLMFLIECCCCCMNKNRRHNSIRQKNQIKTVKSYLKCNSTSYIWIRFEITEDLELIWLFDEFSASPLKKKKFNLISIARTKCINVFSTFFLIKDSFFKKHN